MRQAVGSGSGYILLRNSYQLLCEFESSLASHAMTAPEVSSAFGISSGGIWKKEATVSILLGIELVSR